MYPFFAYTYIFLPSTTHLSILCTYKNPGFNRIMFGKYQMNRVRENSNISYFKQAFQFTPSIPLFVHCIFGPEIMKGGGQHCCVNSSRQF